MTAGASTPKRRTAPVGGTDAAGAAGAVRRARRPRSPVVDGPASARTPRRVRAPITTEPRSAPPVAVVPDELLPLKARGVAVRFGGVLALGGVDIEVRPGEIVGLIGANGAGKTTFMDCVSGFVKPDEGSVLAFGNELGALAPELRPYAGVGRSFQDAKLFPGLTVEEALLVACERHRPVSVGAALLRLPSAIRAEREKQAMVDELIGQVGLEPFREKLVGELSTGTRRVLDIASILAQRPSLLLLDEPTAGVAQRETEAFGPLLLRVQERLGCAVLLIEHDIPLVRSLAHRLYAMEAGLVITEGPPEEVLADPRVVSSYLGTSTVAINRSGTAG